MTFVDIRGRHINEPEYVPFKPLITQRELAKKLGVCQKRACELEHRAMRKFVEACEWRAKRAKVSIIDWLLCEEE